MLDGVGGKTRREVPTLVQDEREQRRLWTAAAAAGRASRKAAMMTWQRHVPSPCHCQCVVSRAAICCLLLSPPHYHHPLPCPHSFCRVFSRYAIATAADPRPRSHKTRALDAFHLCLFPLADPLAAAANLARARTLSLTLLLTLSLPTPTLPAPGLSRCRC